MLLGEAWLPYQNTYWQARSLIFATYSSLILKAIQPSIVWCTWKPFLRCIDGLLLFRGEHARWDEISIDYDLVPVKKDDCGSGEEVAR